ncbi:MAG: tetratricopeptide repeat protein, partial [Lewinella sp.]|nr:tetratricopeptide repeat protein [Lewinella sp.]
MPTLHRTCSMTLPGLYWFLSLSAFLVLSLPARAQNTPQIDSLQALLVTAPLDTNRVLLLADLSYAYLYLDMQASEDYGRQTLALAEQLDWPKGIALAHENTGRALWRQGDFEQALSLHLTARDQWRELGDEAKVAYLQIYIGQDYIDDGHYPEGLQYLNEALEAYERLGMKHRQSVIHNIIAWVYGNMGMEAESLEHEYASLRLSEELGDQRGVAISSSNLASHLFKEGRFEEAIAVFRRGTLVLEALGDLVNMSLMTIDIGLCFLDMGEPDSAMVYFQRSLEISTGSNNSSGIAMAYNSIGDVLAAQNKMEEALENYLLAADYFNEVANKPALAGHYAKIGRSYVQLGQYASARRYFDRAFVLNQELNSTKELNGYYEGRVLLDSATGHWQDAFSHYKLFIATRDSMYNEENTVRMVQTRMQYEFDKIEAAARAEQEKKDTLASQRLQRQKLLRNGFMGGFGVVVLFAGIFFGQRNRIRKGK